MVPPWGRPPPSPSPHGGPRPRYLEAWASLPHLLFSFSLLAAYKHPSPIFLALLPERGCSGLPEGWPEREASSLSPRGGEPLQLGRFISARTATGGPRNREGSWPLLGLSCPLLLLLRSPQAGGVVRWTGGCAGASAGLQGLNRAGHLSRGLCLGKSPPLLWALPTAM